MSTTSHSVCEGQQQITLRATSDPGTQVTWYPGGIQADTISVSVAGTYIVTAEKNGCYLTDSISVNTGEIPTVQFSQSNISTCCEDYTLAPVTTGNGLTYHWSDNSSAATNLLSTSGTYSLTITNDKGCTATGTVNFNKVCIQAKAFATPDTIQIEDSTQLTVQTSDTAGKTYIWQGCGLQNNTIINPMAIPQSTTTYVVYVNDSASGCRDSASVTVLVLYKANFGVPNVFSPNDDGNNDNWHIVNQGNLVTVQDIKIFDRWGEIVFSSQRDGAIEWNGKYEGKLQPMGNYVYNVLLKINATGEEKFLKGNLSLIR